MYCENQIDPVTWWRSTEFRQKSFISLSLATKREIQESKTMAWKTILMRSFWYQKFEDLTIHVTVATCAKFWGLKLQNGFTHATLRGRDPIFRYCLIIQTCSFIWASQNKFSTTLQISGFISTENQYGRLPGYPNRQLVGTRLWDTPESLKPRFVSLKLFYPYQTTANRW